MKLNASKFVNETDWDKHVFDLHGCGFHSYKWSIYSSEGQSTTPVYFNLVNDSGQTTAVAVGYYWEKKLGVKIYSSISFGSMAASDSPENQRLITQEIYKYCREKNIAHLSMNSLSWRFSLMMV